MTPHDLRPHFPSVDLPSGYDLPSPVVPEFARLVTGSAPDQVAALGLLLRYGAPTPDASGDPGTEAVDAWTSALSIAAWSYLNRLLMARLDSLATALREAGAEPSREARIAIIQDRDELCSISRVLDRRGFCAAFRSRLHEIDPKLRAWLVATPRAPLPPYLVHAGRCGAWWAKRG